MTDDANLTPGGEMNDDPVVEIKSDETGYTVEWSKGDASGSLGSYQDEETALKVLEAKRLELTVNDKPI
jgi:hypothetical protein